MKKIILLLYLFLCSSCMYAQSDLIAAEKHFQEMNYGLAIPYYKKALTKKNNLEVNERIADCYRLTGNSIEAERWYDKALKFPHFTPTDVLYYAEALRSNGKYLDAEIQYEFYTRLIPAEKKRIEAMIRSCQLARQWIDAPEPVTIINEKTLNTKSSECNPVFFKDGIMLTSDRKAGGGSSGSDELYGWTGRSYLKLFFAKSRPANGQPGWVKPKLFDAAINTQYHNACASFNKQQNTIYFSRTNKHRITKTESKTIDTKEFINRLEIWSADYINGKWTNVKSFPYNNIAYSVQHPALTSNGKRLYFSSDMPGGFGGFDLYFCDLIGDSWSKPVNCGSAINTVESEGFPTLLDDTVLYFSSKGHTGMGGLDMFRASGSGNSWNNVSNLQYPFNSPQDDFGIIFNKNKTSGYFSSNRVGGIGSDDIYRFTRTPSEQTLAKPVKNQ